MRKHTPINLSRPSRESQARDSEADKRRKELQKKLMVSLKARERAQRRELYGRRPKATKQSPGQEFREELRKEIGTLLSSDEAKQAETIARLGTELLQVAERGNQEKIKIFIEEGFPVNWQHPMTGQTALHVVAACQARKALRLLLNSGQCDYLIRDKQGRLPSEIAYLHGNDPAVARLLGNKERKQAEALGIKLTRRP
jgi:ankyrin repeat protein